MPNWYSTNCNAMVCLRVFVSVVRASPTGCCTLSSNSGMFIIVHYVCTLKIISLTILNNKVNQTICPTIWFFEILLYSTNFSSIILIILINKTTQLSCLTMFAKILKFEYYIFYTIKFWKLFSSSVINVLFMYLHFIYFVCNCLYDCMYLCIYIYISVTLFWLLMQSHKALWMPRWWQKRCWLLFSWMWMTSNWVTLKSSSALVFSVILRTCVTNVLPKLSLSSKLVFVVILFVRTTRNFRTKGDNKFPQYSYVTNTIRLVLIITDLCFNLNKLMHHCNYNYNNNYL